MDPFKKLYEQLQEYDYPMVFPFKFIGPPEKVYQLKVLLKDCELSERPSRKGNYVSLTAKGMMLNADDIIDIYREAAKIKGVIAL